MYICFTYFSIAPSLPDISPRDLIYEHLILRVFAATSLLTWSKSVFISRLMEIVNLSKSPIMPSPLLFSGSPNFMGHIGSLLIAFPSQFFTPLVHWCTITHEVINMATNKPKHTVSVNNDLFQQIKDFQLSIVFKLVQRRWYNWFV